jgi:hypothetical protein
MLTWGQTVRACYFLCLNLRLSWKCTIISQKSRVLSAGPYLVTVGRLRTFQEAPPSPSKCDGGEDGSVSSLYAKRPFLIRLSWSWKLARFANPSCYPPCYNHLKTFGVISVLPSPSRWLRSVLPSSLYSHFTTLGTQGQCPYKFRMASWFP